MNRAGHFQFLAILRYLPNLADVLALPYMHLFSDVLWFCKASLRGGSALPQGEILFPFSCTSLLQSSLTDLMPPTPVEQLQHSLLRLGARHGAPSSGAFPASNAGRGDLLENSRCPSRERSLPASS